MPVTETPSAGRNPAPANRKPGRPPTIKPETIQQAASRLFLRNGLERTSMDAVAAEAGVSKQTLYRHYPSKGRLFVEVLTALTAGRVEARVSELMPAAALDGPGVERVLETLALRLVDTLLDPTYLALLRVVIAEADDFPELGRHFHEVVIPRGAAAVGTLLRSEACAAVVDRELVTPAALRLFVGPLLSYLLGALLAGRATMSDLARREVPELVGLFITATSPRSEP
jgi:TetR/AcrR family transcriptional regulator, mexJK operon transcriptional repressor